MFMRSVRPAARLAASLAVGYQCVSISSCEDAREMRLRRQATNDDSIGGSFGTRKGHATTHTKGGGFGGSSADADFYEPVHKKVHVLLVELTFASVADREKWTACWSPLTQRVYQNEQNCLSYEMCVANDDPCSVIIYERFVSYEIMFTRLSFDKN